MPRAAQPPSLAPTASPSLRYESELVVAIVRTMLILLAALTPQVIGTEISARGPMQASILVAFLYNLLALTLAWRRVSWRGMLQLMLAIDMVLVTVWIRLTWSYGPGTPGSPLTLVYLVIILIAAMWFSVAGALASAALCSALYLWLVYTLGGDPLLLVDALVGIVVYFFVIAIVAGYLVDTHKREREQWLRSQVLLAQYQERFRAAQEVYELLLPVNPPEVPGIELAARWRPVLQEGGGDFYDVARPTADRLVCIIADVAGKHTRGAQKLPLLKAAFHACAQLWADPGQILSQVNRLVYPWLQPDMFITASVLVIDRAERRLHYANAGQDPPVFVRGTTHETVSLESGGLVLGINEQVDYPTETLELAPGDTLCLFTDGITEARNPAGEEFGRATLEGRVVSAVAVGLPTDAIAENILEAVARHMQSHPRHDDMTLLVMRFVSTEPAESPA
jgi:serine phosphatase RsbU (regulator of sigma subunit)